jgi:hypothetical protein
MATLAEALPEIAQQAAKAAASAARAPERGTGGAGTNPALTTWIDIQAVNLTRHSIALRPFRKDEFGTGAAAPTPGHIEAVNALLNGLRKGLLRMSKDVTRSARQAVRESTTAALQRVVNRKSEAHHWVQGIEKIWDFYFELFGQRQSPYATWLLSCDRIAQDCYRAAYLGLGAARSIPAPPPFCYMRTGFAPATFRRGIPLKRLGKQLNPFPLVQLPYHRLINPWTLGAVLHEVSHNLQSDLGLSKDIPRNIAKRLLSEGLGRQVAMTWTRWNREMFADMSALLLGGPEVVASLMDVIGRSTKAVVAFNPRGVHPTPFFRLLNSVELLRRMGFTKEAERFRKAWLKIYPSTMMGNIPPAISKSYGTAVQLAVDTMCYRPYKSLGNKSLAQVIQFGAKEQTMIEEAARRLASGTDPGIIPERFVIGAVRFALEKRLARPNVIAKNFYKTLASG